MNKYSFRNELMMLQQEANALNNAVQHLVESINELVAHAPMRVVTAPQHAMKKAELAEHLCMSSRALTTLMQEFEKPLSAMGVKKYAKKLPAEAVKYICECLQNYENLE